MSSGEEDDSRPNGASTYQQTSCCGSIGLRDTSPLSPHRRRAQHAAPHHRLRGSRVHGSGSRVSPHQRLQRTPDGPRFNTQL